MKQNYKKITNVNHIRQIVSEVINMLLNDTIDNQTAQAIGTLCSLQLKVLKAVDLDKRIKRLEDIENNDDNSPVVSDIRAKIRSIGG
jgi:capsular polysaccharide biosynthesis protein